MKFSKILGPYAWQLPQCMLSPITPTLQRSTSKLHLGYSEKDVLWFKAHLLCGSRLLSDVVSTTFLMYKIFSMSKNYTLNLLTLIIFYIKKDVGGTKN